ncbi:hypothetical protein [Agromyces italicus]|uniref:hypothetical protein n=1 Tax=Agromyces italicus TaxID=279572 RepID=UPI0003B75D13|nr:hypothetical protein [Agromyces italicus]
MNEIVTIAPWNPWPLAIPVVIAGAGVVVSSLGTRRRSKPVRELGSGIFLIAVIAFAAMFGVMPGSWDQGERRETLIAAGYDSPTFSAEQVVGPGEPAAVAFQAERDGTRVRGVLRHQGGSEWEIAEIVEDT